MGRPLLNISEKRRNPVTIYFNDKQYHDICRIARDSNKSISVYFQEIITREVERKEAAP